MSRFTHRLSRATITMQGGGSGDPNGDSQITHGEQLQKSMTGFTVLGVQQTDLTPTPIGPGDEGKISNWPGYTNPAWYPENTTYVYNNNPSNKGGKVPAGGMLIDGFMIPAGTVVVQFRDFSGGQIVPEGSIGGQYGTWPGVMFRGCRWRGDSPNVGWVRDSNTQSDTGGKIWFHYCDAGGLDAEYGSYCEVAIKLNYSKFQLYRNYISYVCTAAQCEIKKDGGGNYLENYIEQLTTFDRITGNPTTEPHLNGLSINGGDRCVRVERNHIVAQSPDSAGNVVNQTDCIAFFQDGGDYQGLGTNDDGTAGYRVINNYVGGTGYCFYAGQNAGTPATSVRNMQFIGNKVTTSIYSTGGSNGVCAAQPTWGSYGNVKTNNTWADGPNIGQTAF